MNSDFHKVVIECQIATPDLSKRIDALIADRDTNLVRKEKALDALLRCLEAGQEKVLIQPIAELANKAAELKAQKSWLELGFSEELLSTHADSVYFLIRSGFAYLMHFFSHEVLIEGEDAQILFEGHYQSLRGVLSRLMIDWTSGSVVARDNRELYYNYIAPYGIVQKNRNPSLLYPVAKVEPQDSCLLQIITSTDREYTSWYADGLNDLLAHHTSLRLIDQEGNLYSFGLEMTKDFEHYMHTHEHSFSVEGRALVGVPDFREARAFDERFITTLFISCEDLQTILESASRVNEGSGIAFTMTGKNCNYFVTNLLQQIGIDIDTKITIADAGIRAIPVVGRTLEPLFSQITDPFKQINVPLANGIKAFFGGHYDGPHDIFDDEKAEIYHPYRLIDWQKQHPHTVYFSATKHPKLSDDL